MMQSDICSNVSNINNNTNNNNNNIDIDIDIDIFGRNHDESREQYKYDFSQNSTKQNSETNENNDSKKYANIYRYKFTEQIMEELHTFSKIHQYDDRNDFKDAWSNWVEENNELVQSEINRLILLKYEGNILEKMYKSARYYFRKKTNEKKEPLKRRKYISVSKDLLDAMDEHIQKFMHEDNYQPKKGFVDFCNQQKNILRESITKICEEGTIDPKMIENKMKKTYKNRYFMIVSK
jgi:hypothetical protein